MKLLFLICSPLLLISCHKTPSLGPAADNLSTLAPPPMGAAVYNDELKSELATLDNLVKGRIEPKKLQSVRAAMMQGNATFQNSQDAYLAKVFTALPELMLDNTSVSENRQLWLRAKLYFLRRRFAEAALAMAQVLKVEPKSHHVRNWFARALFLLGNPDQAVAELNKIVAEAPKKSPEALDALYIIGAIVHEAGDVEPERIKPGIEAWKSYLALADVEPALKAELDSGIAELKRRLSGGDETKIALDPFTPQKAYSAEKNAALTAFAKEELLLALQLCDQLLKKQDDKDVAIIKARIFIKTGRHDEAGALFKAITTKHKAYAPGFHYRGMAHMLKGEVKEALESWQKTFALDATYARSHRLEQRIAVAQKMVAPEKIPLH